MIDKVMDFQDKLKRKLLHLGTFGLVLIYFFAEIEFGKQTALFIISGFILIPLVYEFLRLDLGFRVPFRKYLKPYEKESTGASVYFFIIIVFCFAVFRKEIAMAAVSMAIAGDTVSLFVGEKWGRIKLPWPKRENIMFEGCLAGLVVNLLVCLILIPGLPVVLVMAFLATVVETVTDRLEDNIAVPIIAGLAGEALYLIM